ncbi:hypothetical protein [Bacillus phage CP-51]|uniref:Uncharacterized protein n=1 Tax=Bacillus phage CP-51 TaxID=1391188 RepID=A0A068EMD3_9CAUD|nr:hypothetical protein OZ73_gp078 [Bacillus phage CP-51]AID50513.1 hypothetical protein [Bacillus phage CP-51]
MNVRKMAYSCIYVVISLAVPELSGNGLKFIGGIMGGIFDATFESIGEKAREELMYVVPEFMQGWFK